tara:strand:+ start:9619 stop:10104 length:486 start_codon:yes stop_codon:yes gene_type:complete
MTSVNLKLATQTVKNLNAGLTMTSNAPTSTSGTYALINDMISNLSSIKASLKTEEKVLIDAINTEITDASGTTDQNVDATAQATLRCSAGLGDDAARYNGITGANDAVNYPAVLGTGSTNKYTESAVFSVLGEAASLIDKLKNNNIGTGTLAFTESSITIA